VVKIKRFILKQAEQKLSIYLVKDQLIELAFEYLRVFSPQSVNKKNPILEAHKKNVQLTAIEPVGKHGYRFIFDDEHSAIYSTDYLEVLASEYTERWQHYLTQLKASGHSREAMINITQL
jgi:DUF971 family protein